MRTVALLAALFYLGLTAITESLLEDPDRSWLEAARAKVVLAQAAVR